MYLGVFVLTRPIMATSQPLPSVKAEPQSFQENLRKLDTRQWWLWSSTVLVLILLTVGVASFAFPALMSSGDSNYSFYLNQSVRALIGIVLVFSVYLVYQQTLIMRMRSQIADQITSIAKVETLTNEVYKLAALDPLTGLYNRRSGEQRLGEEINRATRHERPLTCFFWISTGSRRSTTSSGTGPATWPCATAPNGCSAPFAVPIRPCAWAATNSW